MAVVTPNCKQCGAEFRRPASIKSAFAYCSRECYLKASTGLSLGELLARSKAAYKRFKAGESPASIGRDLGLSRQRVNGLISAEVSKIAAKKGKAA